MTVPETVSVLRAKAAWLRQRYPTAPGPRLRARIYVETADALERGSIQDLEPTDKTEPRHE